MEIKRKDINSIIVAAITLLLLASCVEDDTCNQNTITGVNVSVANSGSDADTDFDGLDHDNVESWRFTALDDTVPLVNSESQTYAPGIPLDMNANTITVLFKIRDNDSTDYLCDTIIFEYVQTDLKLLSVNCGFAPLFKITDYDAILNVLDSVILSDAIITTDMQIENVAFYY